MLDVCWFMFPDVIAVYGDENDEIDMVHGWMALQGNL